MNYILSIVLLLSASPLMAQWRPVKVSSGTDTAIQENFRRASLFSGRKLDRFSSDTLYGQPIFKKGIKFNDGTILTSTSTIAILNSTQTFTGTNSFTHQLSSSSKVTTTAYITTTNRVCIPGSSTTIITTEIKDIVYRFGGFYTNGQAGNNIDFIILKNGSVVGTVGCNGLVAGDLASSCPSIDILISVAPGTHNFCVEAYNNGGNFTVAAQNFSVTALP